MKRSLLKSQKGFTLVELLVVIVILGILAAMIVPRMLAQTQAAETAEAVQMLGTIRRQAINVADGGGGNFPAFNTATGMAAGSGWATLGMGALPATRKFDYSSAGGATGGGITGVGARIGGAAGQTVTIDLDTGALTCGAAYTAITDAGGAVTACR